MSNLPIILVKFICAVVISCIGGKFLEGLLGHEVAPVMVSYYLLCGMIAILIGISSDR